MILNIKQFLNLIKNKCVQMMLDLHLDGVVL
jgi:hypothetical protein